VEAAALHAWIDYHAAAQELGLRETIEAHGPGAEMPGNVVRFPGGSGSR